MRTLSKILLTTFLFVANAQAELKPVSFVDLGQYAGTWYQIAHNPLFFEDGCVCSIQKLSGKSAGVLNVVNSCNDRTERGPLRQISGTATVVDASNAKLSVDFGLPQKGDYWIIGLASDYRFAVVSDPSEKSLYILSKTPELDAASYQEAVSLAAAQTDITKLEITHQTQCVYP